MPQTLLRLLLDSSALLAVIVIPAVAVALTLTLCAHSLRRSLGAWIGIDNYIRLTFPGVVVHEAGHLMFCLIFRHRIVDFKLFAPEADGTLGYVNHAYHPGSFYQRVGNFFIGTGPVWLGLAVIYAATMLLLPELPRNPGVAAHLSALPAEACGTALAFLRKLSSLALWGHWQSWLWLLIVLTVGSHIALSPPDLAGAADGFIMLMVLLFGVLAGTGAIFGFRKILLEKLAVLLSHFYGTVIFMSIILVGLTIFFFLLSLLAGRRRG